MSVPRIMAWAFVVVSLVYAAVALRTGKAHYGHLVYRSLYVERERRPTLFWLLVASYVTMAIYLASILVIYPTAFATH